MWKDFPLFPEAASAAAGDVDLHYFFIVAINLIFTVGVFAVGVYFAIKYRRKHPDEIPPQPGHSHLFEIVGSAVPFAIVMVIFGWGTYLFYRNYTIPAGSMEIFVVGKQWMWKLQHPEGHREINELHLPVGQPVKLTMTTEDVLHSFYVPAFRIKKDVVPGHYMTMSFTPTKVGKYHLFCAEYCGTQHSGMIGWVHVQEPSDYEAWLSGTVRGETMVQAGERIFGNRGCNTCHKADNSGRCPTLENVFGSTVTLANGGKVVADEAYLRESILKPTAKVVAGYQNQEMPTFQGQLSEDNVLQLLAYIKSLKKEQKPEVKK
jgi:cytochrome c oxidase subunit 2